MPRIRLLPENNARQGFADAREIAASCRRLTHDLADPVPFMFITGWRSRSEVLPLTSAQDDLAGGFGTTFELLRTTTGALLVQEIFSHTAHYFLFRSES